MVDPRQVALFAGITLVGGCFDTPACVYETATRIVARVDTAQRHSVTGPGCSVLFTDGVVRYDTRFCVLQPGDSVKVSK